MNCFRIGFFVKGTSDMESIQQQHRIYTPSSLGLRVSYRCNINCRFCYNISTAKSEITMEEERLLNVIDQCHENGFKSVGFSGGEIFLFAPTLYRCIRRSRDLGYSSIGIVSNGYWGKTVKSTKRILTQLIEVGFSPPKDRVSISAGEFHMEFLDWTHVRNIANEYYNFFSKPLYIDFEVTPERKSLIDQFNVYMAEQNVPEHAYDLHVRTCIANVGRWKELSGMPVTPKSIASFRKCNSINRFIVAPEGEVMPCCGFNRYIKNISVGNVNTHSVAEILDQAQHHTVTRYLTMAPLNEIYAELSKKFELPSNFSVICELCEAIFDKQEHVDYLESIADEFLARYRKALPPRA